MIIWLLTAVQAQEASGFAEVRGLWYAGADGVPVQVVERVRPTLEAELSERVLFAVTVEASLTQGRDLQQELERTVDESTFAPLFDPDVAAAFGRDPCVWPEPPDNALLGIDGAPDYLAVDRLYVDLYQPRYDLRVGRQALNWGSAQFTNPTDPFPEVLVTEPWRPRAGVNAARLTVPIDRHQVQAVVAGNDSFTAARAAARATANVGTTDVSLVGAYRGDGDDGLVGLDLRGTLGVGFWFEGALHIGPKEPWEELAVGVDYSLPVFDRFLVGAQYYRQGSGATDPDDYTLTSRLSGGITPPDCGPDTPSDLFPSSGADPFAPFFAARDYGLLFVNAAFTPSWSATFATIQNANDGTGLAVPTVTVAATGAWEISASGQIPYTAWGQGGELDPRPRDLRVGEPPATLDLSGLLPDATAILWTRASF